MRIWLRQMALGVGTLVVASSVNAATIDFVRNGSGLASVGTSGFFLETVLDSFRSDVGDAEGVGFALATGRAAAFEVDEFGGTTYRFTDGVATFTFDGTTSTIDLLPFTLELSPVVHDPFWGGDGPVALMAPVELMFAPGSLRQKLAREVHVRKRVIGGGVSLVIDDIRGDALDETRTGVPNWMGGVVETKGKARGRGGQAPQLLQTSLNVETRAVPEPPLLALMAAGAAAAGLRRWRRA